MIAGLHCIHCNNAFDLYHCNINFNNNLLIIIIIVVTNQPK